MQNYLCHYIRMSYLISYYMIIIKLQCYLLLFVGKPKVNISVTPSNKVDIETEVTFSAMASGVGADNFFYKWLHNKSVISEGPDKNNYTITHVKMQDNGYYKCNVSNQYNDVVISKVIKLKVLGK